jgi:translation initiation factor 3 subunit H
LRNKFIMASASLSATLAMATDSPKIDYVQIDSLVVMKIVKHVDLEFYAGISEVAGETCQGILTGLISVDDKRLEITNCFPTPRSEVLLEGDETNASAYAQDNKQDETIDMLKRFRNMNIDYELVGFYQAHLFGACFNHDVFLSMVDYQLNNPDAVVLIYDPVRTRQGLLTLKAYRLSRKALELGINNDWSPEVTKQAGLNFSNLLEELPIIIKNSHLMNVMISELALCKRKSESLHLELGTRRALEKSMRALMLNTDELSKSMNAYNKYAQDKQKFDLMYNSALQKRAAENEVRAARGEPPLPIDDIKKALKQPQLQAKSGVLDLFLSALDTAAFIDYQTTVTGENLSKLFISQAASNVGNTTNRS